MILDEVEVLPRRPALAELRPVRAGRPGARRARRRRPALRPADQAGLPARGRPGAVVRGRGRHLVRTWLERPVEERGHMRTYTIRDVVGAGADTRLVVDIVLHDDDGTVRPDPALAWAAQATVGDRLVAMAPRKGMTYGGIEFAPGDGRPAAARRRRDRGAGDRRHPARPARATPWARPCSRCRRATTCRSWRLPRVSTCVWLPRDGARSARWLARGGPRAARVRRRCAVEVADDEVDPDLWETPAYSSSGEDVDAPTTRSATTSTTCTSGSPVSPRSSPGCGGCWSRTSGSTGARWPSWATGGVGVSMAS